MSLRCCCIESCNASVLTYVSYLHLSQEENDPTKIVSLCVMGEYDELNDLVRDGSKKLRESKSLSDEAIFMLNRPRPVPPHMSMSISPNNSNAIMSPTNSASGFNDGPISPSNRKRVLGSRYKNVPRSAPPKLKGHPRDTRTSRRSIKNDSWANASGTVNTAEHASNNSVGSKPQQQQHYFREQCNFFPGGNSDWTEALGFSVNSLWNCGANNGHMSPTSNSISPRSNGGGGYADVHHGYHGSGYSGGYKQQQPQHYSSYHPMDEGRNPSSPGYGYRSNGRVRDTTVM